MPNVESETAIDMSKSRAPSTSDQLAKAEWVDPVDRAMYALYTARIGRAAWPALNYENISQALFNSPIMILA